MLLDLILEMNPDITDLDVILQGQRIRLPDITDTTAILKFSEASYTIHLGTFTVQDKGMEYRHGLVLNGKKSEIVSRKVSGRKLWYRLLVGSYRTPEECRAALAILKVTK
jgi:cell division protein FtsN